MKEIEFDYVGECSDCGEPVDESDAGYCADCNQSFHWAQCGDWYDGKHCCNPCKEWAEQEGE